MKTNNKISVALVDDHVMLRQGLAAIINSFDEFEVCFEADNGRNFIDKVKSSGICPGIVLLDVQMPIMPGPETAEWIQQNLPESRVLVLTMNDEEKIIIRMLKAGARGYILKNGNPSQLSCALKDVAFKNYHFTDLVNNRMIHYIENNREEESDLKLSEREKEFLKHCCSEDTYKEIATKMSVSARTIDSYRDQLFIKLSQKSRVGLVLYAIKTGLYSV